MTVQKYTRHAPLYPFAKQSDNGTLETIRYMERFPYLANACLISARSAWLNSARPRSPSVGRTSTPPTTEETRQYTGSPGTAPTRHTDANPFVDPGRAGETPPQTKTSSTNIMNCFQHALTGFTTHAYSLKRLALPRLPQPPPFRLISCALHTHTHLTPQHWLLCHLG